MKREQLHDGRTYLALDAEHPWPLVRVTEVWDAVDHEGVAFDILEPDGTQVHHRGSALPDHRFLVAYRPAFEALDDRSVPTLLQLQDAVQEIRHLVDVESDDDAAAGLEKKLHLAVLRAIADGSRNAQALAQTALETGEIRFQRHTW